MYHMVSCYRVTITGTFIESIPRLDMLAELVAISDLSLQYITWFLVTRLRVTCSFIESTPRVNMLAELVHLSDWSMQCISGFLLQGDRHMFIYRKHTKTRHAG